MKLSVIILNYNVRYFLEQCILSVQRATQNIDAEIIVVDNNSQDDSCSMVKERFSEIVLIENKENVGFSKANNQGVEKATGEFICILNPDTAVSENTFIRCIQFAASKTNMGIVGVRLIDGTGNFLPESKRNIPSPVVSLLKMMGLSKRYYASKLSENGTGKVEVLVGAFMFLRKAIYQEVNGFDEDYFMYGEDIDLSYKITKAGYQNYYLGTTTVLHYKGESTQRDSEYLDRFYGAMQIFYKKHFDHNALLKAMVNIGVALAKKMTGLKKEAKSSQQVPTNLVVLTENFSLLSKLTQVMGGTLKASSKSIFQDSLIDDSLFILDVNYMPYSQIFSVMHQLRNRGNQFRICPPHAAFMLGSDASDEKGTVTVF